MKFRSDTLIVLYVLLVVVQEISLVCGQDDEYEYYYEDEITSTVAPTTTTTTSTTTTMRTTATGKRKPTRKVPGSSQTIIAGPGKNGKQMQQACSSRTCVGYQYGRPDVVFNVIADMYDLQAMLPNNRRNGAYSYMSQNKEFASRFEQPFAYWYGPRQPAKPVRRPAPALIDYGIVRRPGVGKETVYGYYDDGGDLYTDYYDYYEYADYDYPAKNKQDAKTKDSNRLFVNFILKALGPRRSN